MAGTRLLLAFGLVVTVYAVPSSEQPDDATKAPPPQAPRLVDVTDAWNIRFRHVDVPQNHIVEEISGGVLLVDYNRDGWLDIYFTNSPTLEMALEGERARSALYRSNRDNTFTDVTEQARVGFPCEWPMGGAVGDHDNDGWPDLYITCLGRNTLYRNQGDGTFSDVTEATGAGDLRWSTGAAFSDYDGDGWVDLFVANYVGFVLSDLAKLRVAPKCPFKGVMLPCGPEGLPGAGDSLYRNTGNGRFTDVSSSAGVNDPRRYYGLGAVWADIDDDGRPDLYVANDSNPNFLYRNRGGGQFSEVGVESGAALSEDGTSQGSMGIAVGDYLHSGVPSLFVTNLEDEYNIMYRNDGGFRFTDVSRAARVVRVPNPYVGWGAGFADFDNDGWVDLFVVNGHLSPNVDRIGAVARYRQPAFLYMNRRDGTFHDAMGDAGPAIQTRQLSRGCAAGDLDNDGDIDVVIENLEGQPMVLRNDGGNRNHWITIQLARTRGNVLALGTRVTVHAGGVRQVNEVRSGGSYLSQNDLRLHFGLGSAAMVERIEIRWPAGRVEVLRNVPADRFYAIREGSGIVPAEALMPGRTPATQPRGPS